MSTIQISNLLPAGSDLFSDFESYMTELGDSELDIINGGSTPVLPVAVASSEICLAGAIFLAGQDPARVANVVDTTGRAIKKVIKKLF